MASAFLEPYHPVVRPAGHAAAVASFSWFMQGNRELAAKYAAELDDRERVEVLLAVCRFAATLYPPPCDWCGRDDCGERFDHERLYRGSETTWRKAWKS